MYYSEVERFFKTYKNGRFFRISYETMLPIKSHYKNQVVITKIVDEVGRTGIYYPNIEKVTIFNKKKVNNKKWLKTNCIFENLNNNEKYLRLANLTKGSNKHCSYIVKVGSSVSVFKDTLPNEYKSYIIDSYFKKGNSNNRPVKDINISNIISMK